MEMYGGVEVWLHSLPQHWTEVSGQLQHPSDRKLGGPQICMDAVKKRESLVLLETGLQLSES
jgi:hypothetical protein